MGRDERNGGDAAPTAQTCLLPIAAAVLMFGSIVGCFCAGAFGLAWLSERERPHVGETAVVLANPRSEYTVGNGARAAGTYEDFAAVRDGMRAGDRATVEAVERRGGAIVLAAGELVEIVADELLFEEVYEVRVVTGPHAGKTLFVSWASVRKGSKHE